MENAFRCTLSTMKLLGFGFLNGVDYVEIHVKQPQPVARVYGDGRSVQVILDALPFLVSKEQWGDEVWCEGVALGLITIFWAVDTRIVGWVKEYLSPDAPDGRIVRFFRRETGQLPEVIDPK